jgi:hypothetical protein
VLRLWNLAGQSHRDLNLNSRFIDDTRWRTARRQVLDAGIYSVGIMNGSSRNLRPPALAIRDAAGAKDPSSEALLLIVMTDARL